MGIFTQAYEMADAGHLDEEGSARRLYDMALAKMEERYRRKNITPKNVTEAMLFELQILQSLALAGWELDSSQTICRKGFLSPEALIIAEEVLQLAGARDVINRGDELFLPREEMDRILSEEAE